MKKVYLIFILTIFGLTGMAQNDTFTATFITLGNCSICKTRIENAANQVPGVSSVSWSIPDDATTVTYYTDSTDLYIIMHAIANVGHDTEWFPAPDSAYNLLIGTCCEYARTIDYSNVQIGYLSLMGIWVFPLELQEVSPGASFTVFPNPVTDFISLRLDQNKDVPCTAILYSLTGTIISSTRFTESTIMDLNNLIPGEYIITVVSSGIFIGRKKIIKQG